MMGRGQKKCLRLLEKEMDMLREGTKVIYEGKEYPSLRELSRQLGLEYSPLVHKFYRTNNIEESVEWAKQSSAKSEQYVLWGKQYQSYGEISKAFGLNNAALTSRILKGMPLEQAIEDMLSHETITYRGKEYENFAALVGAYNKEYGVVTDRLRMGFSMDRALFEPVKHQEKPSLRIRYRGKTYDSKRHLCREIGIYDGCIREMQVNNGVDFETAVDLYCEVKRRAGIPFSQKLTYIPICILHGKFYKTVVQLANDLGMTQASINTYKHRHGYEGTLEALQAMQKETKVCYAVNEEMKTTTELLQMGYTSASYPKLPKREFPMYPQLQEIDLVTDCVDTMKIYREVKAEMIEKEEAMQLGM